MDGYNIANDKDMFRFIDKLRRLCNSIKDLFKRSNLEVTINDKRYKVIGIVGMYHLAIDITGSDVKLNDFVYLDVNPLHVDNRVRREYV